MTQTQQRWRVIGGPWWLRGRIEWATDDAESTASVDYGSMLSIANIVARQTGQTILPSVRCVQVSYDGRTWRTVPNAR